jgi:8-oxo-dGTP pyrophosphatase MutT (NUDIX family)
VTHTRSANKIRPAATVVLLRDRRNLLQVYLLRRSSRSSFFPGSYVFPGGVLDAFDLDVEFWKRHVCIYYQQIERRFGGGLSAEDAVAYCLGAIRETFEEAGLLIGVNSQSAGLTELKAGQQGGRLPRGWLREWAQSATICLDLGQLSRWAHWITPEGMPQRFDTRFFMALQPVDQSCAPDRKEMDDGLWVTPSEALSANLSGRIPLSPPTLVTLQQLLTCPSTRVLKDQWETRPWGQTTAPRLNPCVHGPLLLEPWDPQWDDPAPIDTQGFENLVLQPGAPFSRLFLHQGLWKPVRLP